MQNNLDKQAVVDPHGFMPGFTTPAEEQAKQERIGEHPEAQAEKLLSKPILIPRNPWALITQVAALVLFTDVTAAVLILALAAMGGATGATIMLATGAILLLKTSMLVAIIIKMSIDWVPDSYEITDRQLIKKKGVATKEDKVYELTNIRHVSVHQNFVGRQLEYGDIELLVATAGLNETIRLTDVKDPHHFEEVFRQYLG